MIILERCTCADCIKYRKINGYVASGPTDHDIALTKARALTYIKMHEINSCGIASMGASWFDEELLRYTLENFPNYSSSLRSIYNFPDPPGLLLASTSSFQGNSRQILENLGFEVLKEFVNPIHKTKLMLHGITIPWAGVGKERKVA